LSEIGFQTIREITSFLRHRLVDLCPVDGVSEIGN